MRGKIVFEIPDSCRECRLFVQDCKPYICAGVEYCFEGYSEWLRNNYAAGRPNWCPIVKETAYEE